MPNPMAQKWERKKPLTTGLTRITVELNETQIERIDQWIANDTGAGRQYDRAMVISWCVSDCLGLNRPVPFTPMTTEKGPR